MDLRSYSPDQEWRLETLLAGLPCLVPDQASGNRVERLTTLTSARRLGDLCFLSEPRRLKEILELPLGVSCLLAPELARLTRDRAGNSSPQATLIETKDPKQIWCAIVERILAIKEQQLEHYIADSAIIDSSARLHSPVHIGACSVIAEGVEIGAGSIIDSHCVIEKNVKIGERCRISAKVFIANSIIEDEVWLHQACVIGGQDFGIMRDTQNIPYNFPQLGGVRIGRGSQIFMASSIGGGTLDDTIIGEHVRIGCQSIIAHNCQIGDYSILSSRAALSGSTRIGQYVTAGACIGTGQGVVIKDRVAVGGLCSFWPNVTLHEGVQLMNGSTVKHDLRGEGKIFFGNPAIPLREELHRRKKIDRLLQEQQNKPNKNSA